MAIILDREQGLLAEDDEQIGLECPYCGVYAHMSPQSVPRTRLLRHGDVFADGGRRTVPRHIEP